jgi:hypothetical protein
MNVGIGTEAMQFLFREYINWILGTVLCKPVDLNIIYIFFFYL